MALNYKTIWNGIKVKAKAVLTNNALGEIETSNVTNKTYLHNGTINSPIVTADGTETLLNKTIDANGTGNSISNLETADLAAGVLNTSTTLTGASNTQIPSALAVKTYVDDSITDIEAIDIPYDNVTSGLTATNVQDAIDEVDFDLDAVQTILGDHIADPTDAHDASAISVVPTGNLAADDVQEALVEHQVDIDGINTTLSNKVTGPASATDEAIARFDSTTGKLIQNSTVTLTDSGVMAGASISGSTNTLTNITATTNANLTGDVTSIGNATTYSGTVPLNKGGTGQTTKAPAFDALSPMTTGGDLIYGGASGTGTRLANGSSGQVLTSGGGTSAPTWTTPGTAPDSFLTISNLSITTSVSSNALTVALKDAAGADPSTSSSAIAFRSATLTSGTFVTRTVTSAVSVVVSSGSTLGHASAVAHDIYVYAIDNAGTVELAVSQTLFDETKLVSTTAEGGAGAADSNRVMYSTTARSNVAFRLIGKLISTQTTAGTWAAVPTNSTPGDQGKLGLTDNVRMYYNGTPTGTLNGSSNLATFPTKQYDTKNSYASGVFTVTDDGYYIVNSCIVVGGTIVSGTSLNSLMVAVNGTSVLVSNQYATNTNEIESNINGLIFATAGQTIGIQISTTVTSPTYASTIRNRFSISRA